MHARPARHAGPARRADLGAGTHAIIVVLARAGLDSGILQKTLVCHRNHAAIRPGPVQNLVLGVTVTLRVLLGKPSPFQLLHSTRRMQVRT